MQLEESEKQNFFEKQFTILREKLAGLVAEQASDAKLVEPVEADFKRVQKKQIELLNAENEILHNKVKYLLNEIGTVKGKKAPESQVSVEELNTKLHELKSENLSLQQQKTEKELRQENYEEVSKKQLAALRGEIEGLNQRVRGLTAANEEQAAKLSEKTETIRELTAHNQKLVETCKRLDEALQLNDSAISNS